jgi:glycerol-3-phosphate acyltransferase PlsY
MKGLIPILLYKSALDPLTVALAMPAAVLGHNFSVFLRFRGGVGAGTAIGTVSALSFTAGLFSAVFALIAMGISRYASILSTTVAVSGVVLFTIFAFLGYTPYQYILGATLNLIIMFNALRPNFARIRAGTERRIGDKTENIAKLSSQNNANSETADV